jgi:hypothetical protein
MLVTSQLDDTTWLVLGVSEPFLASYVHEDNLVYQIRFWLMRFGTSRRPCPVYTERDVSSRAYVKVEAVL